ncbi:MAG: RluA family pseudouridine synthase [Victivallaceae bacterium]|nr:RluA family pseudouridine synthase [Victivallaceae bacterium]
MNPDDRIIETKLNATAAGIPLDRYLAARFTYHSPGKWRELIGAGRILLNGRPGGLGVILQSGDVLTYLPLNIEEPPVDFNYSVIYEDEYLLVINKPGDLPCHPAGPFFKHTLWYHLRRRYGRIHLISRLDRETSGLLLAVRSPRLAGAFNRRTGAVEKEYRALVFGRFAAALDAAGFLIQDTGSNVRKKRRFVFAAALPPDAAVPVTVRTRLEPVSPGNKYSLVRAIPETGRLHQIRASLFSLGFPVVGDKLYGPDDRIYLKIRGGGITAADWDKLVMRRQALHSFRLAFQHPVSREKLEFTASLPEDWVILE